ncbi:MAG TPA: DinB family protein [Pyrinomonadaceae bacterium]|nr:DinB family protein [Pyrinomonadaceae bacterium]
MEKTFRKGAIGALMDEYERATAELKSILQNISEEDFTRIADSETEDKNCRSIQTVMSHVVIAGYGYANYIREQFSMAADSPQYRLLSLDETIRELDKILDYMAQTLDGKWELSDDEINRTIIKTRWGGTYDLEQLLEHAIVHILRHRRQIEKFLLKSPT